MRQNFTTTVHAEGKAHTAVILPAMRRNGLHYEVNIPGYPRFWMRYGAMGRYEVTRPTDADIPDELALAVSDAIEASERSV